MEDAACLLELAVGEDDQDSIEEAGSMLASVEARLAELEFTRILGGPDDARNAIVSVNAGAGGTEAQDWGRDASSHVPSVRGEKGIFSETA